MVPGGALAECDAREAAEWISTTATTIFSFEPPDARAYHRRLGIVHWAACDVAAIGLRNTIRNEGVGLAAWSP